MLKAITFVKESWSELKQSSWLTTPQMIASTWLVVILSMIVAVYIFFVDFLLKHFFGLFV